MGYFHLTYCTMFTKWLKMGISDMQEWTEEVLESNKTLFLCFFFIYVQNLWQGQKAFLTIVELEFFDILYSKFQLVSTFSICSKFCVENWLFCCDLSCKWVTCRSGCKRFWKSALHISSTLLPLTQFLITCFMLCFHCLYCTGCKTRPRA